MARLGRSDRRRPDHAGEDQPRRYLRLVGPGGPAEPATADPELSQGTLIGKRYVNAAGTVELLCVKAGKGSLSIDGEVLQIKDAKPLPSSD